MNQISIDTKHGTDQMVHDTVQNAAKAVVVLFNEENSVRNVHEAFGIMAEAEAKLLSMSKTMKKAMAKMLETLETGMETPAALGNIEYLAEQMAEEAILMAAKGRNCIDYLTYQARIMKNVDPETGEIRE